MIQFNISPSMEKIDFRTNPDAPFLIDKDFLERINGYFEFTNENEARIKESFLPNLHSGRVISLAYETFIKGCVSDAEKKACSVMPRRQINDHDKHSKILKGFAKIRANSFHVSPFKSLEIKQKLI